MRETEPTNGQILGALGTVITALLLFIGGGMYGCPKYKVWQQGLEGEAELNRASQNRKIAVNEAEAKQEAAKALAQAEVERAKGVAEANRIIGEGLKGHEEYLRYLWIMSLEHTAKEGDKVVYVPTEANLPVLEAGRFAPVQKRGLDATFWWNWLLGALSFGVGMWYGHREGVKAATLPDGKPLFEDAANRRPQTWREWRMLQLEQELFDTGRLYAQFENPEVRQRMMDLMDLLQRKIADLKAGGNGFPEEQDPTAVTMAEEPRLKEPDIDFSSP